MLHGLFIASLIGTCHRVIKEAFEPTISAENWANKELYHRDMMNGVSVEQLKKNVENGKYRMTVNYPEPHRNKNGQIVFENNLLYKEDLDKYGAYQTYKWARQGKYNLSPEELEKEHERIRKNQKNYMV